MGDAHDGVLSDVSGGGPDHVEHASDSLKALWEGDVKGSKLSEDELNFFRQNGRASLEAIRDLRDSGNRLLAGCDGIVPGFCLHYELEWFTKAGLSALESLQTATINPARYLNRERSQGTINVGMSGGWFCSMPIRWPTSATYKESRQWLFAAG